MQLVTALFGFLLTLPLFFGVQRHILLGVSPWSVPYVRMFASVEIWRYALLFVVVFALVVVPFLVGVLVMALPFVLILALGWDPLDVAPYSLVALVFALPVWMLAWILAVKISLASALLARGESGPLRRSWRVSKGGLLRLTGLYVLLMIANAVINNLFGLMLGDKVEWGIFAPLFLLYAIVGTFTAIFTAALPCQYLRSVGLGPPSPRSPDAGDSAATAAGDAERT